MAPSPDGVLLEWRASTIDVELASPGHFIPELPGWEDRSPFMDLERTIAELRKAKER